jgi:hypothetical protein
MGPGLAKADGDPKSLGSSGMSTARNASSKTTPMYAAQFTFISPLAASGPGYPFEDHPKRCSQSPLKKVRRSSVASTSTTTSTSLH